ncbi:nucleotide exchange factor GrpE [Patescibacteria group bacterium]|nr:nucleotide exchange factor GrpE [Patescibacteria group bacterium]
MNEDDVTLEAEDGEGNTQTGAQKLADLREKLKKTQKERDEYLDSLQRMKADYINARKRFEEDGKSMARFAAESVVAELLPVMDALEMALQHGGGEIEGIKNIKTQLEKVFAENGVSSFGETGEVFDPALHEPVETLAVETLEEDNRVTKVHQKGYSLNGRIIRPARIAVAHYQK